MLGQQTLHQAFAQGAGGPQEQQFLEMPGSARQKPADLFCEEIKKTLEEKMKVQGRDQQR